MENETNKQVQRNDVFSKRIRAGKRRTYFFDVRTTKGNDYYLTITESKKRFHDDGYERHKIFVYKEDFNKFVHTLEEVVAHIKSNLMPDYDFDTYTRDPEDITNGEFDDEFEEERVSYADGSGNGSTLEANHVQAKVADDGQSNRSENGTETEAVRHIQQDNEEEVVRWD